jgi:DMSO/TMAO reductase YedYZ molybdopterin-dependent catalytic subunit
MTPRQSPATVRLKGVTTAELTSLIARVKRDGISRRQLLKLFTMGGIGAVLAACERVPSGDATAGAVTVELPWVKDPGPFLQHPTNLETRLELLDGVITPNELFFVRNHAPTPRIDPAEYRMRITGDAVDHDVELSLNDLQGLPSERVVAYLECAGNWRSFWLTTHGQAASGGQWTTGGVSCAEWRGPTLASVLALAGIQDGAVDVDVIGVDDGAFSRPMPVAKALDPSTLIALTMNGEELPPDHGYPARAMVPGWAGSNSVKWVGEIRVTRETVWSKNNTTSYVLIGDEWPMADDSPADGGPITAGVVKSALALPRPGNLSVGANTLAGFAYSPDGPVQGVEWSADGGVTWNEARIVDPVLPHAWQRFEFDWDASAGRHTLLTRATDAGGATQPDELPFNDKGYLLNVVLPHDVVVS